MTSRGWIATVDVGADHLHPNGVVHGAVLFALVDTAMGTSTMSVIDEPGRYVAHLDARVAGDDERLIATAAGTFAILGD